MGADSLSGLCDRAKGGRQKHRKVHLNKRKNFITLRLTDH